MRKGGSSSAPTTPRGGQATQLAEEHHVVSTPTMFVQADVKNFREVVQKLTGGPPSPAPPTPPAEGSGGAKELSPASHRRDGGGGGGGFAAAAAPELQRIGSVKSVVGGGGPQRTSTAKLLERRQNARNLEVQHLMGPHILKRAIPPALSPVSPLTTIDVFGEQASGGGGATSPLGYMGYSSSSSGTSPAPPPRRPSFDLEQPPHHVHAGCCHSSTSTSGCSSPGFDLNSGIVQLELETPPSTVSPREPRLLTLFPLHSPKSLSS